MSRRTRRSWARLAQWVSNPTCLRIDRWLVATTGFSFINQFYSPRRRAPTGTCHNIHTRAWFRNAAYSPYPRGNSRRWALGQVGRLF